MSFQNSDNIKALGDAVLANDVGKVRAILETRIDPNECKLDWKELAFTQNSWAIVRLLITHKACPVDVNKPDCYGVLPIVQAVMEDNIELVKLLLTEAVVTVDVNQSCNYSTALTAAVCEENMAMVKLLVEAGANIYLKPDEQYDAPLQLALKFGHFHMFVFFLETCGVDICMNDGQLFSYAIRYNQDIILDYLLHCAYKARGDDLVNWWTTTQCCSGREEPLHAAIEFSKPSSVHSCVSVLLRWGLHDSAEPSVFQYAADIGCRLSTTLITQLFPQALQEDWFVQECIPSTASKRSQTWDDAFLHNLYEQRKLPSQLMILCRTKIFQKLGIGPVLKAEKLPLPQALIEFVQCKEIWNMTL